MAYIVTADLTTRLGATRLANLVNDAVNQAAILTETCTQASEKVDGYLGGRYTVPVTASLGIVENWALAIAEWQLYRRGSGPEVPAKVRQEYEDTLRDLRDIAAGRADLPGATAVTSGGEAVGLPVTDSDTAVLDGDSLDEADW